MSEHKIEVLNDWGELHLRLVCTAAKGAPCKRRPAEGDRETWWEGDADLIDTDDCWAVEWQSAVGFIDGVFGASETATWASIPVSIDYEEGVLVAPIPEHTTLPESDGSGSGS